MKAVSNQAWLI